MGIRYYAYAFDADLTERAVADPDTVMSDDPLADAWGFPHGTNGGPALFEQIPRKTDMLYLDKAWRELQRLTESGGPDGGPRSAFRMFEGQVNWTGPCYRPWQRTVVRPA